MKDNIILQVKNVSKRYRLGVIGGTSLIESIQTKIAALLGKEDPNSKIGEKHIDGNIVTALNNVSFEVKKGERIGLIGKNGAGKSTLLKLICRLTSPSEGYIGYNGKVSSMLEVGTGFNNELTGRENIYLNGAILGMSRLQIQDKFDDIVEFSEIGEFLNTPLKRYSSGMFVRLAFAVSSFLASDIVIMDEVLAVGDLAYQKKCIDKMMELATNENKTIFYVSHNMQTIKELCNRVIVLDKGRIIFDGDTDEAIKVYIDKTTDNYLSSDDIKRREVEDKNNIRFESAELINQNDNEYRIKVYYKCLKDIDKISIRVTIHNVDQSVLGSKNFYDLPTGKINDVFNAELLVDVSSLSNGVYQTTYSLFDYDKLGNTVSFDIIEGIPLQINKSEIVNWDKDKWGNVELK